MKKRLVFSYMLLIFTVLVKGESILHLQNVTVSDEDYNDENNAEEEHSTVPALSYLNITNLQQLLKFATVCETPNHEPGFCIELTSCFVLAKQINNPKAAEFLRESHCGPSNEDIGNPKVCCGKYNNFRNVSTHIVEDNKIFPKKCGLQKKGFLRGRIFGGSKAYVGEYPWMVRLIHKNKYGFKTYGCAGFLIHSKYVVTAAHCIHSNFTKIRGPLYSIALGEHNTETTIDCSPGGTYCAGPVQYSRVEKVIVHPDYNSNSLNHYNDIALIYMKKGARLSDYVQPICLLTDSNHTATKFHISGWGKTETKETSSVKLKVDLNPFDKKECQQRYQMLSLDLIDSQLCAGGVKMKDSCSGDSGGPLMMSITDADNGTVFYAAGLVSYGVGCGMEGWPGVYTNIPSYVEWLKTQILANSIKSRSNFGTKKKRRKGKITTTAAPATI